MKNLDEIFLGIKKVLEKRSEGLTATEKYIDSNTKDKHSFHLYGNKEVSLYNKKPQKTYIGGVIQQKNYVSFYLLPVYSHPELKKNIDPDLKKYLKGKSCFNITKADENLLENIEEALDMGIKKYQEINWI
ncbi:MAG: hypothetical protein ACW981_12225 [Candidatus Hodarchaeales archaeon]|jgi:hypothetical protein